MLIHAKKHTLDDVYIIYICIIYAYDYIYISMYISTTINMYA